MLIPQGPLGHGAQHLLVIVDSSGETLLPTFNVDVDYSVFCFALQVAHGRNLVDSKTTPCQFPESSPVHFLITYTFLAFHEILNLQNIFYFYLPLFLSFFIFNSLNSLYIPVMLTNLYSLIPL